jgi:hypothetical protein
MKRRTLLFLSAYSFHARLWQNGSISKEFAFADDIEGHQRFAGFLSAHNSPVMLLTDLIEEDFRNEILPHLRGGQKRAQHQRKFEQFYRNTPFRQAILHRRQTEGRRDDEVLFSALTNPHLITPWLEIIQQQQIPLIGIYSVPTISTPLLKSIPSSHVLLLSWENTAGLRQTYFNDKCLYLSRLSPINPGDTFSNIVAAETSRTLQYLKNLSMLPLGETLHVGIICHANDRRELEQAQFNSGDIAYHYLDIQELGHQFRISGAFTDSDATPLLLGLLAAKPPTTHYAAPEHTHIYRLHQLRRRMFLASGLIAAASLLWGAVDVWQSNIMNDNGANLEQQAQQLERRTQEIIAEFPHQLASPADMKSAVTTLRTLNSYSPAPETVWSKLSVTLNDFPRIRIDHLTWQTSMTGTGSGGGNPTLDLNGPGMLVSGELEGWSGDYRGALDYLSRFQDALGKLGYTVTALSLPLDVSSKGSITETSDIQQQKPALFSLKITWGLP